MIDYESDPVVTPAAEHFAGARQAQAEGDADAIAALLHAQWDEGRLPWVLAADIARALWPAAENLENAKRRVRAAAEVSKELFSAPGHHGYALRERIEPAEELTLAKASLSQAWKMFRKAWRRKKEALKRMTPDLPKSEGESASASPPISRQRVGQILARQAS